MRNAYGIAEEAKPAAGAIAGLVEQVIYRGYCVLPGVLAPEELAGLRDRLDRVYEVQCAELGGEEQLFELKDADIVRCPLAYDDEYLRLAQRPDVLAVVKHLLGENVVLLMQNGVINRPGRVQAQTRWHRDLNYQHWTSSEPLAISFIICLDPFGEETGGTMFLPGSHRVGAFPSDDLISAYEATVAAPAGSAIIFDSMAFHRAGANRSGQVRRGVNHVIGRPILAQQVDIPAMLRRPPPEDPWVAGYLGYRWRPVEDVLTWRLDRLARLRDGREPGPA